MAFIITTTDIRSNCPTSLADPAIQALIDFVSQADTCLDSSVIPDPTQRLLKVYAVCHMLTMQSGGGVKSESDMDGESVTFANVFSKAGLGGSHYGSLLSMMPGYSCIAALLDNARRSFKVVNYS